MKKKFITVLAVVLLLCAAVAAAIFLPGSNKGSSGFAPVAYVQEILDNTDSPAQVLLRGLKPSDRSGAIFIIGPGAYCDSLSGAFLRSESFDNIDGSRRPDALPDFAGETICSVADFSDFEAMGSAPDDSPLRELAVRSVLASVDTLCYVSPYDPSGIGSKPLPKLIILALPYVSAKGRADLDTLLSACGCGIPVLEPVKVLTGSVPPAPRKKGRTVGVIDPSNIGCYPALLGPADDCIHYGDIPSESPLTAFLDRYIADGHSAPLDMLLLNDPAIDAGLMREEFSRVTSVMNEESLTYGNLFSKGFKIVDAREAITTEAFSIMRRRNLFTHYISSPACLQYMLLPRENAAEGLMFMEFNERFIPSD